MKKGGYSSPLGFPFLESKFTPHSYISLRIGIGREKEVRTKGIPMVNCIPEPVEKRRGTEPMIEHSFPYVAKEDLIFLDLDRWTSEVLAKCYGGVWKCQKCGHSKMTILQSGALEGKTKCRICFAIVNLLSQTSLAKIRLPDHKKLHALHHFISYKGFVDADSLCEEINGYELINERERTFLETAIRIAADACATRDPVVEVVAERVA